MDFRIDFSQIDRLELRKLGILTNEVESVIYNPYSYFEFWPDFKFCLGFSHKRKFIQFAFVYSRNPNFDLQLLQIDLADEKEIKKNWCPQP